MPAYRLIFRNANLGTASYQDRPIRYGICSNCATLNGDATRPSHPSSACPVRDAACASRTRVIRTRERLQQPLLSAPWIACWPRTRIAGKQYGLPSRASGPRHVLFHEGWPSSDGLWLFRASGSHSDVVIREFSVANPCSLKDHTIRYSRIFGLPFRSLRTSPKLIALPPL